jgi:two-component system phosphate regulon response regulator PhoB
MEIAHKKTADAPRRQCQEPSMPMQRSRILIIDDDDLMKILYGTLFGKHEDEFRARIAATASDALEDLKTKQVDALILDWDLPVVSGVELLTALRRTPSIKHLPVIVVSGRAGVENEIQALESGADDYLTKPFDVNVLLARLRRFFRAP